MSDPNLRGEGTEIHSLLKAIAAAIVMSAAAIGIGELTRGNEQLAFLLWEGIPTKVVNGIGVLCFWIAIFELRSRSNHIAREESAFRHPLLPEDVTVVIDKKYIPTIVQNLKNVPADLRDTRLCQAVELCASKYQSSTNVGEVAGTAQMYLDNESNHSDSGYSLIRYLVWAIPSIGFVGTVMGLATALGRFQNVGSGGTSGETQAKAAVSSLDLMRSVSGDLLFAFNTTFVALALSLMLMFYYHRISARQERLFNRISDYCLKYFVSKAFY